jgi:hypothetical protein
VLAGNDANLRSTIRSYMQGPAFDRFLDEAGMTHFLTNRVVPRGNNRGLSNNDFPALANLQNQGAFDAAVRREPTELMKFIVRNDRPWSDIVAADYTVVNPAMAAGLGAQMMQQFTNPNDMNEWRQARVPERQGGMREHAGVLSTHSWLDSFPTTPTNRNRHRVNVMAKQFLATDVTALAVRPIDDGRAFVVPVMENPGCAVCHDVIDPIAAGWQNWQENNRYRPNVVNNAPTALPASYRATSYPNDAQGREFYQAGDNWFRDGRAPGFGTEMMPGGFQGSRTALQWVGGQVATDARFPLGAVHFWYEAVFGRAPLQQPLDPNGQGYAYQRAAYDAQRAEFTQIASRFAGNQGNGVMNVRDLLVDLVMSNWFRAETVQGQRAELADVGSVQMLLPSQIQAKLQTLVGQGFNGFNNPYAGQALNFGDFDGNGRVVRAREYTMMQTTVMDGIAASMSCGVTQADFGRAAANRLLFPLVSLQDTPATPAGRQAITENIRHLHNWLWKENLPASHAEIQRTVNLYNAIWSDRGTASSRPLNCGYTNTNDPNYTGRSWAAIVAYMIGDAKFIFE